ncbi:MAG: spore germination protein [Clostridia bacterium]|nr:spore germination protein [Clostridia bacterium]
MKITGDVKKDAEKVKKILSSDDIIFFSFSVSGREAAVIYVDSITDKTTLGEQAIRPLSHFNGDFTPENLARAIEVANVKTGGETGEMTEEILSGNPAFLVQGVKGFFSCDLKKFEARSVSEPPLQTVIKGPREGFNESIKTNVSLLRRRIKNESLKIKNMTVGKVSQTAVSVVYISEIADEKLVKDVLDRIGKIDIDNVSDSSYIAKLICSREASVFKQLNTAEKPDVVVARIMEGRVAIIVDGSPIVLTLPYLLVEDFQNPEDYYMTTARALFTRWIRFAAVCIAVLLPAFYVASELFHLQFLPLNFLLTIINSIKGIPMAPSFEMFFVLVIFEVLNEASTRMPKYAGMALSVVGALVLGETAVQAGIVSTPAILIMSISAISLYTVPELVETMSLIRLIMLIVAGCAGGYGIIIATVFITAYLCSLENFGVSILAPYAPTVPADMKDSLYIAPLSEMDTRPLSIGQKNKRRFRLAKDGGKK